MIYSSVLELITSEITPSIPGVFSTTMDIFETSDLLPTDVDTKLPSSIWISRTVEDMTTNMFETLTTTIMSDMVYTPWISPSYLVQSSQPMSSPVLRSTVLFPSVSYGTFSTAFPRTDDVTTEIFSTVYSELTLSMAPSTKLVGSERSTIFDDIIPTPSESTGNRVKRSVSHVMSEFETVSLYETQTLESNPSFQTITPHPASNFQSKIEGMASDSMIYSSVLELITSEITSSVLGMLSTTMDFSETSDLLPSDVGTKLPSSIWISRTVEDMTTNMFETLTTTIMSDMVYTPWITPSYLVPSSPPISSPVSRSTVLFPSVSYGPLSTAFPRTDDVTTEIFSTVYSELTLSMAPSTKLVGPERSTIFDDIIPTPSESTGNRVKRSISQVMSSGVSQSDLMTSWLTSEVVETEISSENVVASDTLPITKGSTDFIFSTSFFDGSRQTIFDTLSLYETLTVENTLSFKTLTPEPSSNFQSTFWDSVVTPHPTNSMGHSSVLDLITSYVTVSDNLVKSSEPFDSLSSSLPSSILSIFPSEDHILRSSTDETILMSTELVYSTIVPPSSISPSCASPVHSKICFSFPSGISCTCTNPPPSLPPNFCSTINCGSSRIASTSMLPSDYSIDESFIYETVVITTEVLIYPTPDTTQILPSYDVSSIISQSTRFFTDFPISSKISQPETTIGLSPSYSFDSEFRSYTSSQMESLGTQFETTYMVETSDIKFPSSEIVSSNLEPSYTYTSPSSELTPFSTFLDQSIVSEPPFTSVFESQTLDIFTSLAPSIETSYSFPYPEFSRSTLIPDTSEVVSTFTDVYWTDIYETITTEVFEYITTDVYDSLTVSTDAEVHPPSTIFPRTSQPSFQTQLTLQPSSQDQTSLSSAVIETTIIPIDTSVVSYISSIIYTSLEESPAIPITSSVYLTTTDIESGKSSPDVGTASYLFSTIVDSSTILETDITTGVSSFADSTLIFSSEDRVTSFETITSSLLYSTGVDFSTVLVSDSLTGIPSMADSTMMPISSLETPSLRQSTPSFLYSTVEEFSTLVVTDSITDSTVFFSSEIGTASLLPISPSFLYSSGVDLSTSRPTGSASDAPTMGDTTLMFISDSLATSLEQIPSSFMYFTVTDMSTILVTDTVMDTSSVLDSTMVFSTEIRTTPPVPTTPSFPYSTRVELSTILLTDSASHPPSITFLTSVVSSESGSPSLVPVTPSFHDSTLEDFSTIMVTETIADSFSDSMMISKETGSTSLESILPSLPYSTVTDSTSILITDTIIEESSMSPSTVEFHPPPSTMSFPSSLMPSMPTFTPMVPSSLQTPYLDTTTFLITTTVDIETLFSMSSSDGLSSFPTDFSEISVTRVSSAFVSSDYLTETLVTSNIVSVNDTDTLPGIITSTDYSTLLTISSDSVVHTSPSASFETITTIVVDPVASSELTPSESLQITSMDTSLYTTFQDTLVSDTLVIPSTAVLEYSSSGQMTPIIPPSSSLMPGVSTSDSYETVSSATTDFMPPPFSTFDISTSSIGILPSPSTPVGATSIRTTTEASTDSSSFLETLSIITPTSELYQTISSPMATDSPTISSGESNPLNSILTLDYSSFSTPPFTTVAPLETTDYVVPTTADTITPSTQTLFSTEMASLPSSSYAEIETSAVISEVITDTASRGYSMMSSGASTSTILVPSSTDPILSDSSRVLESSTLPETPPSTSFSSAIPSLSQSEKYPSTFSPELTPSESVMSSSAEYQETASVIMSTRSQLVTPSIPPPTLPIATTTESPIEVPSEFQLAMDIKVSTSEDIMAEEFSDNLSNNLEILYIEAGNNIFERRRRSNPVVDLPLEVPSDEEWIFTRKQQTYGERNRRQLLTFQGMHGAKVQPLFQPSKGDSSPEIEWMFVSKQIGKTGVGLDVTGETNFRKKRQTDLSDDIEVPILTLSRPDDADPETVTLTFYVTENDTMVLASEAASTYGSLTEAEMSAQIGYAVRSMPHPVVPAPTTTPDYPYTIPPANQADWLKVILIIDTAFDETNATFQKQLRNDLEFLYVNGSAILETNSARTRRDVKMEYTGDMVFPGDNLVRERRAADPSSLTEVALESVDRSQADGEDVDVVFYVVDEGSVVPGATALIPYQQFSLQELEGVLGYQVVSPGVTLFLTATSTGLDWWWYLLIALAALFLLIVTFLLIYYYCWSKKTAIKTLDKVDRSTSVELGFLRLEKETKPKLVVMETVLEEKPSKRGQVNGSASREADKERLTEDGTQKYKRKKKSKRAKESTREYAKRGYLSDEDDQLFSHVDVHATKPKTKKPLSASRVQNNMVYPEAERLPPLKHRSLVAYSETESELSNEQLRMMRRAGMPKSWYTTHIDKDPEELKKDIAREKKRQRKKKEKKIQDQLTAEQMQKEFDAVLDGMDEQGIKNPTARQLQYTRTDRWKPKGAKRKSEIPESVGHSDESAVRLIRTRPLESEAPAAPNHEDIKREIVELLKRGPPKAAQGPFSNTVSVSQEEAKEAAEKKEREVRLRRKWAEERKRLNRILDEAFALSSTSLGNSGDQAKGDTASGSNGNDSIGAREFGKDLEDSGYLRRHDYYGYDRLDDSILPGMIPGRLPMSARNIPLYETSFGFDSGEHLYDSIRRPPIEYEFLPSQMRSDGAVPAYGVSVSPVRAQRARVSPYPVRGFIGVDPHTSLNSSLNSSLQPMQITPRNQQIDRTIGNDHQYQNDDRGQDIIRVQEENLSLQRLVAKQQRELDHALALIGQPNSRIDQPQKSNSKEEKIGSNGRKQRKIVPVNSTKPLNGPSSVSAWTDDHKAVEKKSHPLTSTPNKDNLIKVKPKPSQKEGSVVLEHHIEKPGKDSGTGKI
ncbi:mucin-17-like [Lytechinus pictus]|uniref:mucin-17-like n=1 Tax=Lytechinus pictus TaxID=7653 RepID=UPI0030B9D268